MKNLQIVKIENGTQAVSAFELYKFLEPKTPFNHWIKRMLKYGFEEGQDYVKVENGKTCWSKMASKIETCTPKMDSKHGGHNLIDYILTLDCAKSIAMVQRSVKGRDVRNYFLECERKAQALEAHANALLIRELNNYRRMEWIRAERRRLNREAREIRQDMAHIEVIRQTSNQLQLILN